MLFNPIITTFVKKTPVLEQQYHNDVLNQSTSTVVTEVGMNKIRLPTELRYNCIVVQYLSLAYNYMFKHCEKAVC